MGPNRRLVQHRIEIDVGVTEIRAEMSETIIGRRPDLDRGIGETDGDV